MSITYPNTCSTCNGSGYLDEEHTIVCDICLGTGAVPLKGTLAQIKKLTDAIQTSSDTAAEKAEAARVLAVALQESVETNTEALAEIKDIFLNLSPTCKVASCINTTEYQTLVDVAKDGVRIVLSCGFVDMREGQWARTTLWAIFGANSLTRAALIAMFG